MHAEKTKIKIRRAIVSDATTVSRLIYEAFAEYRSLYTDKGFEATTPPREEIETRINNKAVWLVLGNGEICGTVSVFPRGEQLYIRSMAVSPKARGKGIGKILMEHVHEMAFSNGCSSIMLNTTPFLLQAIGLYESVGFKREGAGDLFGTPLIKMIKSLKPATENKSAIKTI